MLDASIVVPNFQCYDGLEQNYFHFQRRFRTTMKTPNYLAKLPQEATIKSIPLLKDYNLITLDVPTARECVLTAALMSVHQGLRYHTDRQAHPL